MHRQPQFRRLTKSPPASDVISDRADESNFVPKTRGVNREIEGRPAEQFLVLKDVPKDLTDCDNLHWRSLSLVALAAVARHRQGGDPAQRSISKDSNDG